MKIKVGGAPIPEDGYLKLPDRPGIGFEAQNTLYAVMRGLAAG